MKLRNLSLILIVFFCTWVNSSADAQVRINININPPAWAPPAYARTVRYYYIPELDCYYDASRQGYYFNEGDGWFFNQNIPDYIGNVDLYKTHRIVVNFYGSQPYTFFDRQRYGYVKSYHQDWEENGWYRPHDHGKHKGWYKHHGDDGNEGDNQYREDNDWKHKDKDKEGHGKHRGHDD